MLKLASILSSDDQDTIIECEIINRRHDGTAVCVVGVEAKHVWLPLSVCEIIDEYRGENFGMWAEISVPNWLVAKKPLV